MDGWMGQPMNEQTIEGTQKESATFISVLRKVCLKGLRRGGRCPFHEAKDLPSMFSPHGHCVTHRHTLTLPSPTLSTVEKSRRRWCRFQGHRTAVFQGGFRLRTSNAAPQCSGFEIPGMAGKRVNNEAGIKQVIKAWGGQVVRGSAQRKLPGTRQFFALSARSAEVTENISFKCNYTCLGVIPPPTSPHVFHFS